MRVLLADDDRVLTHYLSSQLRSKGCDVVVVHDAMQLLTAAMRSAPDVIVLDIQMPGGTGREALRKLKQSTKTAHIPVLVLTGLPDADLPAAVRSLGAAAFLLKPVEADGLYERLRSVLRGDTGNGAD
jgi:DNA-binding response OmpR family regulator